MTSAGFDIKQGEHPIVPIMLYDAVLAQKMAAALLDEGIYVIGFFFPVVPKGEARIRVQISAGMDISHLDRAVQAFVKVGKLLSPFFRAFSLSRFSTFEALPSILLERSRLAFAGVQPFLELPSFSSMSFLLPGFR